MENQKNPEPGSGIRSTRTTSVFRAVNFELFAKPVCSCMIRGTIEGHRCIVRGDDGHVTHSSYYTIYTLAWGVEPRPQLGSGAWEQG